jgi:hypothetical protein
LSILVLKNVNTIVDLGIRWLAFSFDAEGLTSAFPQSTAGARFLETRAQKKRGPVMRFWALGVAFSF